MKAKHALAAAARAMLSAALPLALTGSGCGEPLGAGDLLTLVVVEPEGGAVLRPGRPDTVHARVEVTFRDWFNGGVVVEGRASSTLNASQLGPLLAGGPEEHAEAWEVVMASSSTTGMLTRPMVGYQTLIRSPVFDLPVTVPAADDSGRSTTSFYIVAYLADVEEVEGVGGEMDSVVVTPYGREAGILNDVMAVVLESP